VSAAAQGRRRLPARASGQGTALYPEKPIYEIAGFMSVRGRDLVDAPVAQAVQSDPRCVLSGSAATGERQADGRFRVGTEQGTVLRCGVLVLTVASDVRLASAPAGEQFLGRGLAYVVPG
jgi:thioredoxin reductase